MTYTQGGRQYKAPTDGRGSLRIGSRSRAETSTVAARGIFFCYKMCFFVACSDWCCQAARQHQSEQAENSKNKKPKNKRKIKVFEK